jgi:hypothetical protein
MCCYSTILATGDSAGATGYGNVKRWHDDIRANEAACLRLVSAVLMEISEDWQTADKRYVVFDEEGAIKRRPNLQKECCITVTDRSRVGMRMSTSMALCSSAAGLAR